MASRSSFRRSRRVALSALLVGLAWYGVFSVCAALFTDGAPSQFRHRDDGIITLSHARGLVDVGTVSVGASGARVEGFSAPVQFAAATAYFAAGGHDATTFMDAQVAVTTFALGLGVFLVVYFGVPGRRLRAYVLVSSLIAVLLFPSYAFLGWHASGMENAITNALVTLALASLLCALRHVRWLWLGGTVFGLLGVTRTEFVVHALPLLAVAGILVWRQHDRPLRRVIELVAPAAAIWSFVFAARWLYFGSLEPNSGVAQRIDPVGNLGRWLGVTGPLLVAIALIVALWWRERSGVVPRRARSAVWGLVALGAIATLVLGATVPDLPGAESFLHVQRTLGTAPWIFGAGALALLLRPRLLAIDILTGTVITTGLAHLFVFGEARLSPERVVSFVLVPLGCLVAGLLLRWDSQAATARLRVVGPRLVGACVLGGLAAGSVVASPQAYEARNLCCDAAGLSSRLLAVADHIRHETGLPVVRIANPDLGALTLPKTIDVIDLGWLGDPVLTRVWQRAQDEGSMVPVVAYLNDFAAPDIVEMHESWVCTYSAWQRSERFAAQYEQIWRDDSTETWLSQHCTDAQDLTGGIWVRRDLVSGASSPEVTLSRALAHGTGTASLDRALEQCAVVRELWGCQWVTRAAMRNLRVLDDAGLIDRAASAFRATPTTRYDMAVLSARDRGDWYLDAMRGLEPLFAHPPIP